MDSAVDMLVQFERVTADVMNGSREAHTTLEKLCTDISDADLGRIIEAAHNDSSSSHNNSLYFATQVLTKRIVQNPAGYPKPENIWSLLLEKAASVNPSYPAFVRSQFIKSAANIIILTFFRDAVDRPHDVPLPLFREGPLFTLLGRLKSFEYSESSCSMGSLAVIEFLDELLYQIMENWRLNMSIPYDHISLIRRCLTHDNTLNFFVKLGIELGDYIIASNNFVDNRRHVKHLCEFFEKAVTISMDKKKFNTFFDDKHYYPPLDLDIQQLSDFAFMLKAFVPENDELSLPCYGILIRLCYASGPIFGNETSVSRYRGNYRRKLTLLLNSVPITHDNLDSILSLLSNFTSILYLEASFDRSITQFSECVVAVLHKMVPLIIEKMFLVDDHQIRKILRNFGEPMKYLMLCLEDDEQALKPFHPIVNALLGSLITGTNALSQDEESCLNYKAIIRSITTAATFFFEEFHRDVINHFQIEECNLENVQDLITITWYFYEIADIMRRSYSEDTDRFGVLLQEFYRRQVPYDEYMDDESGISLPAETHEKCIRAYHDALNGTLPDFDRIDYVSSYMAKLLLWLNTIVLHMKHNDSNLFVHNSNLLAATFWALQQGIHANSLKAPSKYIGRLILQDDDFSSILVQKLLHVIFHMMAMYRECSHVVKEAIAVLEAMETNEYFYFQFGHLLGTFKAIVENIKNIPERRTLFKIGAKAACNSSDEDAVRKFIEDVLKPFKENFQTLESDCFSYYMIVVTEIYAGIADVLTEYPDQHLYGNEVKHFFNMLNTFYIRYRNCPEVITKIFDFISAAIPSLISYSICIKDTSIITTILNFIQGYCNGQSQRWNDIDAEKDSKKNVYDDLIILMNVVHDVLGQLAISICSDNEDDSDLLLLELGSRSLDIFMPCMNDIRFSVPDVLKAFSKMLFSIAEYSVFCVIDYVKDYGDPLSSCLLQIVESSNTPELMDQTFSILDFILQQHSIIYTKPPWRKFFRFALNQIFNVVITSSKEDSLYLLSRNCLFYIIYADKSYCCDLYFEQIVEKQPPELKRKITEAFDVLCNFDGNEKHFEYCRRKFLDNYHQFRNRILGNLRFDPHDMDMKRIVEYYASLQRAE